MKYAYKIITAILAVAVLIVLVTTPIASVSIKSTIAQVAGLIGQYTNNEEIIEMIQNNGGKLPEYITENFAVADAFNNDSTLSGLIDILANTEESDEPNEAVEKLVGPAVTLLISAIAIVACAVAAFVTGFLKDNRKVIYSAIWGIASCFMFNYSFETIANLFLSGKINFENMTGSAIGVFIGEFSKFELPSSFWMVAGVFAAMIVFTLLYNYTLPDKEKAARKEMLG